jgi:putative cardiolipin synthase
MLTNSLASNDVAAVNSHYKLWRKRLLEAGVELHEARADAATRSAIAETAPVIGEFMGLHMKAIVIDRKRVMLGSMNLDPRSWSLNSEMGVVIESPALADEVTTAIELDLEPQNSWRLSLSPEGDVRWRDGDETLSEQPARNLGQRIEDLVFMLFPRDLY